MQAAAALTAEQLGYIHDLYEATLAQQQRLKQERLQLLSCLQVSRLSSALGSSKSSSAHPSVRSPDYLCSALHQATAPHEEQHYSSSHVWSVQTLTTADQAAGRAASATHAESAACLKRLQANNVEAGLLAISFVGHMWDYAVAPLQMCAAMQQAANRTGRAVPMLPNVWALARATRPCLPSVSAL